MRNLRQIQCIVTLALAVGLIAAASSLPVSAGTSTGSGSTPSGSFSFKIDQNLITLDNTANILNLEAAIADGEDGLEASLLAAQSIDMGVITMWYSYSTILALREVPGILLTNDADSNLNIIGMELSIESGSNQFIKSNDGEYYEESYASGEYKYYDMDTMDYLRADPDQVPAIVTVYDDAQIFSMEFGNGGMKPGRATTFNVKTSQGMYLHDFFDDTSLLNVIYQDPVSNEVFSTGPLPLSNVGQFNIDLVRQVAEGTKNGLHFQGMVDPYRLGGTVTIPEPTSLVLLLAGLAGIATRRRQR
jgi:hypothetical protein